MTMELFNVISLYNITSIILLFITVLYTVRYLYKDKSLKIINHKNIVFKYISSIVVCIYSYGTYSKYRIYLFTTLF